MAHVADYKKKIVDSYVRLIKEYPIVGALNIEGMPAPQLQKMREKLRKDDIVIFMSKRRLIKIAIEKAKEHKKGIEELEKHLEGMPAVIFSKKEPFKLYRQLKQSKSEAYAKAGQTAIKDIEVKAGPTGFMPGPIIGELASVGIKSGVDAGKVAIKQDCVVCKKGQVITDKLAPILLRLNIKPMEIGLNLTAAYENGIIFTKDSLDIDEVKLVEDITKAASESFNLSVEIGYLTKENVDVVIRNVFYSCKALAEESKFLADVVVEDMLASAERSAKSIESEAKIEVLQKKDFVKEEKVVEKETAILKEERNVQKESKEKKIESPVEKEVRKEAAVEEEKHLEQQRIKQEEALSPDDKIAKMVEAQKKHASGEDKKEHAEYLVKEVSKLEKEKQEIKEVEHIYDELKKGHSIKPKVDNNKVPTAAELAARKK